MRTLEDAVGALLGIPIHYYARIDFIGFIAMVDAVGGVDIDVKRTLRGPSTTTGTASTTKGFGLIKAGTHHLTAPRPSPTPGSARRVGETDFTRAGSPAGGHRRPAVERHRRAAACSGGSRPARRGRQHDQDERARRRASPSSPRSSTRSGRRMSSRSSSATRWSHSANTKYGSSQVPEARQDPGRRRPALLDAGHAARSRGRRRRRRRHRRRARPPRPSAAPYRPPASRSGRGGPRGPDRAAAARGSRARRSPRRRRGRARPSSASQ